jgi:hypothetical protein
MNKENWDKFLNGYWTKDKPTKPGTYPTAASNKCKCGLGAWAVIYEYHGELKIVNNWGGYFWSEPIPEMPDIE